MPIGIGAATIGAGALGAGASLYGASKQAKAAKNAAELQQQQYQQTRADLAPYRDAGLLALPAYQRLLGLGPEGETGIQTALEATPGYQFARDQGMKAVTNSLSARGLGGSSGAFGKGLARFVTGLADQTYGSQLERYMNAAGMGQNAANQTGTFGSTAAQNTGNALISAGNAQAGGAVGLANSLGNAFTGAAFAPYIAKGLSQGSAWSNPFIFGS